MSCKTIFEHLLFNLLWDRVVLKKKKINGKQSLKISHTFSVD